MSNQSDELDEFLSGRRLYGDDFAIDRIREWFADEAEAYAALGAADAARYRYTYHRLNIHHAFRFIRAKRFDDVLGIGSAYGHEFRPLARNIRRITILDPSDAFAGASRLWGVPCAWMKPLAEGTLPFDSNRFDLIASLGAMHHIPNVSHVMRECHRCAAPGGLMLLREPIVSMGDWRRPRPGLTKRERGIPLKILDDIVRRAGFTIIRRTLHGFPAITKTAGRLGVEPYDSAALTVVDALVSRLFSWNVRYHRTRWYEMFAPTGIYYILRK